jgi:hypothetical protein
MSGQPPPQVADRHFWIPIGRFRICVQDMHLLKSDGNANGDIVASGNLFQVGFVEFLHTL